MLPSVPPTSPGESRLSQPTRPTLDFVAGYIVGESQSLSELNQRNHYSSTGPDTNIPLYRVAGVSVLSRHASANNPKAQDKLNSTCQEVITGTTREYRGVQIGALERPWPPTNARCCRIAMTS